MKKRKFIFCSILFLCLGLCGCAIQMSEMAKQKKIELINKTKKEILSCMGAPINQFQQENLEVWTYEGSRSIYTSSYGFEREKGEANFLRDMIMAQATRYGYGHSHKYYRSCRISIIFNENKVIKVLYNGNTGGLLTKDAACASAISNC